MTNSWTVPEGWLQSGQTFYWHVKEQDANLNWSGPYQFTTATFADVRDWARY